MSAAFPARHAPVAKRIEQLSGIRPVTLLIAFGIVLVIAILMATGIAADGLRRQTLTRTEQEEARIAGVLAIATDRSLGAVEAQLADIGDALAKAGGDFRDAAATPQIAVLLHDRLGRIPGLAAVAILAPDGAMLASAGAWPAGNIALRLLAAAPDRPGTEPGGIAAPIGDAQGRAVAIPLVHPIAGRGAVVGLVTAADLAELFAATRLPADAAMVLLASDGTLLARYPQTAWRNRIARKGHLRALFSDTMATMIRAATAPDGSWRIEALRALPHYPAAIVVSRSAMQALTGWAYQGLWFAGFALLVAAAIGSMVYLIARQFETHAALAAMRADNAIRAINAEKIEVERARLAAEAELLKKERLSVLGQLTATVAHELRNPLSAIRNTLFTLKELAAGAALKLDRPVARIERSIERCDRIIADLLEYTRHRELSPTAVRFDGWVEEVAAEQSIAPPVALAVELGAGEAEVAIDPDRMRRVVINLVENAVQALAELPAERDKRITLRTAKTGEGEVVLTIADTGPGIAPETLQRIFEPLFSTKSFGTGLGLPTVKQIVNQHGGIIAVDSTPGEGTRVTVRLPLATGATAGLKDAA